jgi:hypothetical protein
MANAVEIIQQSMTQQGYDLETTQKALAGVATLVSKPGAKLVNLGNSVFLVLVKGIGEVEVHTFSAETPQALARNFVDLSKYLKNIGVKVARTYSDDRRFLQIAKMTGLPVKINEVQAPGKGPEAVSYEYVMEM